MEKIKNFKEIIEKLQKNNKSAKMVVIGADNETILECCRKIKDLKIADSILVGDKKKIIEISSKININISDFNISNIKDEDEISKYSSKLIHDGTANIFLKGSVELKTMKKTNLDKEIGFTNDNNLSTISLFEINQNKKTRFIIMSDLAICPYPTLEDKLTIINNSVKVAHMIGIEKPKVAILAAIDDVEPKMKETTEADKLSKMNENGEIKGCIVDGPLSLDLALDTDACIFNKIKNRKIQGDADILIFQDIHSANNVYKALIHLLKWKSGTIIVGAKLPCIFSSISDNFDVVLNSIILSIFYHEYVSNKNIL